MKGLIILFADDVSGYGFEKQFDGKSAFYRTLEQSVNFASEAGITVFCSEKNKAVLEKDIQEFSSERNACVKFSLKMQNDWKNEKLFFQMAESCRTSGAECVLFVNAFCPFLNFSLTEKLMKTHEEFKSEYSFADGFPFGVSPEIIDGGLCNILSELIKTKDELKDKSVSKTSVFDLIKTDINSFEIETEISETDWRLYRFDFCCDKKENFIACKNLYEKTRDLLKDKNCDVQKIIQTAAKSTDVLKTVPAFFNIQIESRSLSDSPYCAYSKFGKNLTGRMTLENFKSLVKNINDLNPESVVSLSLWGEPVVHPEFFDFAFEVLKYPELSLFIETDGFDFSSGELCDKNSAFYKNLEKLSEIAGKRKTCRNGFAPLIWVVKVDAMSQNVYEKIHPGMKIENAVETVKLLNLMFQKNVYAQFLRISENECELERFYRTYKEKDYISSGNFIIQKYDDFCKKMPDCKPCDLSPVDRLPCWHLRRDFNILVNGDVPVCRNMSFEKIAGNVFSNSLDEIWKNCDSFLEAHIEKKYCEGCSCCDEYYTLYF
ncbi:MAG: spiro-SPASM protein [Treponema sp.]